MDNKNNTYSRLIIASFELFAAQGIKKTSVEDISLKAGLTRNTAYRYFGNKKSLVRAVMFRIVAVFENAMDLLKENKLTDIKTSLDIIEAEMAALPGGNFLPQLNELQILYPDLFMEIQTARKEALKGIFSILSKKQKVHGGIRTDLNLEIVETIFMEIILNLAGNSQLNSISLKPEEVYRTVKSIFLYGIMKK